MSLDVWRWRSPLPQGNEVESVAFGNGTFVAVTRAGTVMSSTDAMTWTIKELCSGFSAVRFLNSLFVAVGSYGRLFTSTDGVGWDERESGTSHLLSDVAYGHGLFVAVGKCGAITSSSDGILWTPQTPDVTGKESEWFTGIAYGNDVFLVSGQNHTVLQSSDGAQWSDTSLLAQGDLWAVTYGGGYFVALNHTGAQRSIDGKHWDPAPFPGGAPAGDLSYVNGRFIAVGAKEDTKGAQFLSYIVSSIDGLNWTEQPNITPITRERLSSSAFGNGTYLIGGSGGTMLASNDAVAWVHTNNSDSSANFCGVAYGNGTLVAVGRRRLIDGLARDPIMATSSDLVTWTEIPSPSTHPLSDVVYTGTDSTPGTFIVSCDEAAVFLSEDGSDWRSRSVPHAINAMTIHNGTLVGVCHGGNILRSTDALNWSGRNWGTDNLLSVAYGLGYFVAVGENGTIQTSDDDGLTWVRRTTGITTELRGVAFGDNRFVAVSWYGQVLTSPDAKRWEIQSDDSSYWWTGVYHSSHVPGFMATSNNDSSLFTSPDGVSWTERNTGMINGALLDCTFGNGSFFAVGAKSTVLQSEAFRPLRVEPPVSNVTSPQKSGIQATWHCTASGRGRLRYAFTLTRLHGLRLPRQPRHTKLNFQSNPAVTFTVASAGTYVVSAHVRDGNGTVISRDSLPFVVT